VASLKQTMTMKEVEMVISTKKLDTTKMMQETMMALFVRSLLRVK
jgi:hypothetical protein